MYNATVEIAQKIGFTGPIPSLENVKVFVHEKGDADKVLNFEYTSLSDSHKLITEVYDALAGLEKNSNIIFVGYSLLSQLSIGLLYILAHTFDSLELRASDTMGCVITLKGNTADEKVSKYMREITNASSEAKRKGEAVLSVVPISTLCGKNNSAIMILTK